MTIDLSTAGVLLTTRHRYRIGEEVAVTFRTPVLAGGSAASTIRGRVVRTIRNEEDETLWPYEVAIRFEGEASELRTLLSRPDSAWNIEDRLMLSSDEPSYRS